MRLGRKVHERLDAMLGEGRLDQSLVADVSVHENQAGGGLELGKAAAVPRVGQGVEHDKLIVRVARRPVTGEVRSDETGTAGDEKSHDRPRLIGLRSHGSNSTEPTLPSRPADHRRWTRSPAAIVRMQAPVSTSRLPESSMSSARPTMISSGSSTRTTRPIVEQAWRYCEAMMRWPFSSPSIAWRERANESIHADELVAVDLASRDLVEGGRLLGDGDQIGVL